MAKHLFQKGTNVHRPKGSLNKTTSLKLLLQESLDENKDKAVKLLNAMYGNKHDFKWLLQLKASLEPKQNGLEISGTINIMPLIKVNGKEMEFKIG